MALSEIKMTMSLATAGVTTALDKAKTGIASFTSNALDLLGKVAKLATGALVTGFVVAAKGALEYGKELETLSKISNTTTDDFPTQPPTISNILQQGQRLLALSKKN
jgi:hypothetical protein